MRSVLILFGGASPEHEVSRRSAASVLENINREKKPGAYRGHYEKRLLVLYRRSGG